MAASKPSIAISRARTPLDTTASARRLDALVIGARAESEQQQRATKVSPPAATSTRREEPGTPCTSPAPPFRATTMASVVTVTRCPSSRLTAAANASGSSVQAERQTDASAFNVDASHQSVR